MAKWRGGKNTTALKLSSYLSRRGSFQNNYPVCSFPSNVVAGHFLQLTHPFLHEGLEDSIGQGAQKDRACTGHDNLYYDGNPI